MNTYRQDIKSILTNASLLFVFFSIVSLVLCVLYAKEGEGGFLHKLQVSSQNVSSPVSQASISSKKQLTALADFLDSADNDNESVKTLKEQNAKLKAQLEINETYKQQVEQLQKLLDMKNSYNLEGVACSIVGRSSSAWNQIININAGSDDGIHSGQSVMCYGGVIGQVVNTGPSISEVRLLTDTNSGIAIKVKGRDNSYGIVRGSLEGIVYIEDLDAETNIEVGDSVITSGMGGSYKEGLIVGSVGQIVVNNSGSGRRISLNLDFSINDITDVLVISD